MCSAQVPTSEGQAGVTTFCQACGLCTCQWIRRRARHVLLYQVTADREIRVVRILHDSMDLARHLPRQT
jgi:hypothetical protein